jgi:hypothetical protein
MFSKGPREGELTSGRNPSIWLTGQRNHRQQEYNDQDSQRETHGDKFR